MSRVHVLRLTCADCPGLVALVASHLAKRGANIVDAQQFNDAASERCFMRVAFRAAKGETVEAMSEAFTPVDAVASMQWTLRERGRRRKVLLMVLRCDRWRSAPELWR